MKIKWKKIIKFEWFKRVYILYIVAFFSNFTPANSYNYDILYSIFQDDIPIKQRIYPVFIYASVIQLVFIFLLADVLRYNALIILYAFAGVVVSCMYIWGKSFIHFQFAEALRGTILATEVAYFVVIFKHGEIEDYQRLTSYVRAAPLVGKILSGLLAQSLVSWGRINFVHLHYINLSMAIIATLLTPFLPPITQVIYFNEETKSANKQKASTIRRIGSNFLNSFPDKFVVKWSIWTALTICGFQQVTIHVYSVLIQFPHQGGLMDAASSFSACLGALLGGLAKFNWKFNGDLLVSFASLLQFFMITFMSLLSNIYLNFLFYMIFTFAYYLFITMLSAEIARRTVGGCFGAVFGFIAFLGCLFSSILESLIVHVFNGKTSKLDLMIPENHFMFLGFYHLSVSLLFIVVGLVYWLAKHTYE